MKNVLLLDFDGTLTRRDTTRNLLIALLRRRPWLAPAIALPILSILWKRDAERIQVLKNRCIGILVRTLSDRDLELALIDYSRSLRPLVRRQLIELIRDKAGQKWLVLVVTASPDFAVRFALRGVPVTVVGTRFAKVEGSFNGVVHGLACYGVNKPQGIREATADIKEEVRFAEAWSDSLSDLPMMEMAEKRVWVGPLEAAERFRLADPGGSFAEFW